MRKIVDLHAHYFPVEYLNGLKKAGSTSTEAARNLKAGSTDGDLNSRLSMMDEANVEMQVISAAPQSPYFEDQKHAVSLARFVNDEYAKLVNRYPDRFTALASLPLPHGEQAATEVKRAMDDLGMPGANISTSVLDTTLKDDRLDPVWEALNQREAIVYLHAAGEGAQSPLINEHGLRWIVGAPFEDTIGVLHLLQAGIPVRYPNIKFVVAHLGGPLPFYMQRIDDSYRQWDAPFPDTPSKLLKNMWYDTVNFYEPSLICAVEAFGANRILLGSDYPYFQDELYTRTVNYVKDSRLSDGTIAHILSDNATELLG